VLFRSIQTVLLKNKTIQEKDMILFKVIDDPKKMLEFVNNFYKK
jgi:hypothetical protein